MHQGKKYGIIWAPTVNIGDDIQSLAAINFLKKKGINQWEFINREKVDEYDGEEINLIMNGWFMHNPRKFPPSKKIKPIFLSFHIANPSIVTNNIKYFKEHEPIGCRDQYTVDLLERHGISAYFTGCLTLFFDEFKNKKGGKYLVDLNTDCWYIPKVNVDMNLFKDFEIVKHDTFRNGYADIGKRFDLANEFLRRYANADLVVTTRLHCALPCRALGTKCIFIHDKYESDNRFMGLRGVLNGDRNHHENSLPKENSVEGIKDFFKNTLLV